jgi:hypothetical protein
MELLLAWSIRGDRRSPYHLASADARNSVIMIRPSHASQHLRRSTSSWPVTLVSKFEEATTMSAGWRWGGSVRLRSSPLVRWADEFTRAAAWEIRIERSHLLGAQAGRSSWDWEDERWVVAKVWIRWSCGRALDGGRDGWVATLGLFFLGPNVRCWTYYFDGFYNCMRVIGSPRARFNGVPIPTSQNYCPYPCPSGWVSADIRVRR